MSKIIAFAGSNHSKSINYQLVSSVAAMMPDEEIQVIDIRHWKIPMYSIDMDPDQTPEEITKLIALITAADGVIISSPEHNGGTPAFIKNILDWLSRRADKVFDRKALFLMSTSPGAGGAATNLKYLIHSLPYQGATIAATFSLPSFYDNFKDGKVIGDHLGELQESIGEFREGLS